VTDRRDIQIRDERREHYRKVASFLAMAVREKRFSSLLFSSATEGEGTTTVTLNVARQLKEGCALHPLVVELNVRRPVLTRLCRLDPTKTIRAIAGGQHSVRACIQQTPDGLMVIPAGPAAGTSDGELDLAPLLERILAEVGQDFDCVLVDTPAILKHADAVVAGSVVPHVVLVVEAGRTRSEVLDRAKRELEREHVAIVATVLNKHRRLIPGWVYRWLIG
jgi:Mrp family chromosome partitioning ATPase